MGLRPRGESVAVQEKRHLKTFMIPISSPNPTDSAQGCQLPIKFILSITINAPHHLLSHSLMLRVSMGWVCDGSMQQGQ